MGIFKNADGYLRPVVLGVVVFAVSAGAYLLPAYDIPVSDGLMKTLALVAVVLVLAVVLGAELAGKDTAPILRTTVTFSFALLAVSLFILAMLNVFKPAANKGGVVVAPFEVIDPTGKISNADSGLASLLVSRRDALDSKISLANKALQGDGNTPNARDLINAAEGREREGDGTTAAKLLLSGSGSAAKPPEMKIQGVDLTGLLSWVTGFLKPKQKKIQFTVHIQDNRIAIAGDIKALGIEGHQTVWLPNAGASIPEAVDTLTYRLFQVNLPGELSHLRGLPPEQFRDLMIKMQDAEDPQRQTGSEARRREDAQAAHTAIEKILAEQRPKASLLEAAGAMARRADLVDKALSHYSLALALVRELPTRDQDALVVRRLEAVVADLQAERDAKATFVAKQADTSVRSLLARRPVSSLNADDVGLLRAGFSVELEGGIGIMEHLRGIQKSRRASTPMMELAWNRAFLSASEDIIRAQVPDFAMACWDFETPVTVPLIYGEETVNGAANPLYVGLGSNPTLKILKPQVQVALQANPYAQKGFAAEVSGDIAQSLLRESNFASFADKVVNLSRARLGAMLAEYDRGIGVGVVDPLTLAHNCAMDKLWAQWEARYGSIFGDEFLQEELPPFGVTVADVIDIGSLGVSYP
ncbi:hypothetical protein [Shimia sp. Alg240-R146]|uniref:hypothetical protein n=1 Tax=Shimia sp. Alg240-R146 TaxID=2993449 RepID=UPI0022DEFE10|nr:hypothetical protein [Shimia sp. Alg240-R146]